MGFGGPELPNPKLPNPNNPKKTDEFLNPADQNDTVWSNDRVELNDLGYVLRLEITPSAR